MVTVNRLPEALIIELRPNRSISWRQTRLLISTIGGFCLSIAIAWSLFGAWLILPFAGIEIALLSLLMYLVSKATYQKQVVLIKDKYLSIQDNAKRAKNKVLFNRSALQFIGYETNHPEDTTELFIVEGKQKHRIGAFLNQDDQAELLSVLASQKIIYQEIKKPVQLEC